MSFIHRMKLTGLGAVALVPGPVGRTAETRRLRRAKSGAGANAVVEFERRLGALGPQSVCLDLGANVGAWTTRLAATGAEVHAYEPDPWTFARLADVAGHLPNVTLHNAAVSDADEVVTMRRNPGFAADPETASLGTSILKIAPGLPVGEAFEARCVDLRRVLRELGGRVDLVKIDIEGAEVPLLETLLDAPELDMIEAMFVETHEVNMPELRERLAALRARVAARTRGPYINLDWP
jgi:FkbM family methyltransferase